MPRPIGALVLSALLVVTACTSGTPDLEVGPAQAAEPVSGSSQIVLAIHNEGDGDDRLVEVTSPAAIGVEIHRTEIDDGRAVMGELEEIDIPAGESIRFRPGDLHLMLVVPDETVTVGGTFELTLSFDRSEDVTVPVEVVDLLDLAESEDDLTSLTPDGEAEGTDDDGTTDEPADEPGDDS